MPLRHPLADAGELSGRVVTVLDPDGYVLVDGLLVRAVLTRGRAQVGGEVRLRLSGGSAVLTAFGADGNA